MKDPSWFPTLPLRVLYHIRQTEQCLYSLHSPTVWLLLSSPQSPPRSPVPHCFWHWLDGLARNAEWSKPSMGNWTVLFDFTQWLLTNWNRFKWITCQWNRNGVKCKAPCKQTEHCWELLRPFAHSLRFDRFQTLRNNSQQHATGCANRCKM